MYLHTSDGERKQNSTGLSSIMVVMRVGLLLSPIYQAVTGLSACIHRIYQSKTPAYLSFRSPWVIPGRQMYVSRAKAKGKTRLSNLGESLVNTVGS